jgi:hypothetical protein
MAFRVEVTAALAGFECHPEAVEENARVVL